MNISELSFARARIRTVSRFQVSMDFPVSVDELKAVRNLPHDIPDFPHRNL